MIKRLAAIIAIDSNDLESAMADALAWRKRMQKRKQPVFGAARAYMLNRVAEQRIEGKLEAASDKLQLIIDNRLMFELHAEVSGKGWPFRATPEVRRELSRIGHPYAAKLSVGFEYEIPADALND
jgi:hypothetical protein